MAKLFSGKYGRVLPTDILFFLHIVWAAMALAVNNPEQVIQNIGSTGIEFLGGYLLGRAYIRSCKEMIALLRFLVLVICCTLPLAMFEAVTGRPPIIEILQKMPLIQGAPKTYSELRLGLNRVQMGYITPIHYGLFSMMGLSFCFVGLKDVWSTAQRWLLTFAVATCVLLSLSSGALLPMLLQFFMIAWAMLFRDFNRRWLLLLGMFVLIYFLIDVLSSRTPYRVFMTYATFSPGTAYWRAAINEFGMNNVWAHPIFGIGLNDWVRPVWMHTGSVDNFWLLMAMRYGIPGFVLIAAGYAIALWKIGRRQLGEDQILLNLRRAWVFTFACLAFTLFTVHIWAEIYALVFFLLGAGAWLLSAAPSVEVIAAATSLRAPISTTRFATAASAQARPAFPETAIAGATSNDQPNYTRFPPQSRSTP
ncbi:O-antigen ligase family protein [Cypionkella sp.]|uniref:O-antigen ligase family protein n=1 Tax=Cypionkella sp. TaxID=2811411 RepID=UPI00261D8B2E|nr:O-antigen ligase family protein [Cypionkella sp.]